MSQNYNFKSLQIVEKSKDTKEVNDFEELTVFEIGDTKTINFIMLDGSQQNFSYSHYITSWIGKEKNELVIKVFFSTHLVIITGYCLGEIYQNLCALKLKSLIENDERYMDKSKESTVFIRNIEIEWVDKSKKT